MRLAMFILVVLMITGCDGPYGKDVCGTDSEVFKMLQANYPAWSAIKPPALSNGVATIHTSDGLIYSVRVLQYTTNGQPVVSISTDEGYPRTFTGLKGYFYTPNNELLTLESSYEITQLTSHIYCYQRVK